MCFGFDPASAMVQQEKNLYSTCGGVANNKGLHSSDLSIFSPFSVHGKSSKNILLAIFNHNVTICSHLGINLILIFIFHHIEAQYNHILLFLALF